MRTSVRATSRVRVSISTDPGRTQTRFVNVLTSGVLGPSAARELIGPGLFFDSGQGWLQGGCGGEASCWGAEMGATRRLGCTYEFQMGVTRADRHPENPSAELSCLKLANRLVSGVAAQA